MEYEEERCQNGNYYLGYLSYADFVIYESLNYFKLLLPHER
jgi:hypothetical protein